MLNVETVFYTLLKNQVTTLTSSPKFGDVWFLERIIQHSLHKQVRCIQLQAVYLILLNIKILFSNQVQILNKIACKLCDIKSLMVSAMSQTILIKIQVTFWVCNHSRTFKEIIFNGYFFSPKQCWQSETLQYFSYDYNSSKRRK